MKQIYPVPAGFYWSDSGAFMGVLPYALWSKNPKSMNAFAEN